MKKLLTILFCIIAIFAYSQDTPPSRPPAYQLQSPKNPVFYYNPADSSEWIYHNGIWNKFGKASQTVDSIKFSGTSLKTLSAYKSGGKVMTADFTDLQGNIANCYTGKDPVTTRTISVTFPQPFTYSNYYLSLRVWFNEYLEGKDVQVSNAVYDFNKTVDGFSFKVDTITGYYEYLAVDSLNLMPISIQNYLAKSDSLTIYVTPSQLSDSITSFVPYDGAIDTLDLGAESLKTETLILNSNPTVGAFKKGKLFYDEANQTISAMVDGNVTLQLSQEDTDLCYNNTGSTIGNGKLVYQTGIYGEAFTIDLAIANNRTKSHVYGMTTQEIPAGSYGLVTTRGKVHDLNTSGMTSSNELWLSPTVYGGYTETQPSPPNDYPIQIGTVGAIGTTTGSVLINPTLHHTISGMDDAENAIPATNDILTWNGSKWMPRPNTPAVGSATAFYLDATQSLADNYTLSIAPSAYAEVANAKTVSSSTGLVFFERFVSPPIGRDTLAAGQWEFNIWASNTNSAGNNYVKFRVNKRMEMSGMTGTWTGSGTTRTFTVTGGEPFVSSDANTNRLLASLVETPNQTGWISTFINSHTVTVYVTDVGYVNQSNVPFSALYKYLFSNSTDNITESAAALHTVTTVQPAYVVNQTDRLVLALFCEASGTPSRTMTLYYGGTNNYTHFHSPVSQLHNNLDGLNVGNYKHLTASQYTIATQAASLTVSGYTTTTTQTFAGIKTFDSSPIVPTASTGNQAVNKDYADSKVADIITDGVTTVAPSENAVYDALTGKQATLVSGTNIKTVNSTSLVGSGDVSVQPTLISGTNIKTINSGSILGSGDITAGDMLLGTVQSVTAEKKFTKDKITMLGTSTGKTTFSTANTSATDYTQTFQAKTGTVANSDDVTYIGTTSVALNRASAALIVDGITYNYTSPLGTNSTWMGKTVTGTAGENLTIGQAVYYKSDGKWWKAKADAYATARCKGLATGTINANATGVILLEGIFRYDTWAWTTGSEFWLSAGTAGDITHTQPSTTGNQIQYLGWAIDADNIFFKPSMDIGEK